MKTKLKTNHKLIRAPFVVYADFESRIKKIHGCVKKDQATIKTEVHETCGFSYIIVRSEGETWDPFVYRGENAVLVFLTWLQTHEKWIRSELAPKPTVTPRKIVG